MNDLFLPLISKQGIAVVKLANVLLTHQPGDRIQPIQQYASQFETGVGTVQSALTYLQEMRAVELESRGHLGTFVREINYPVLWSLTGHTHIVGGMPLPYSRRYEGLATGLHQVFEKVGVALNLLYTRGALNRLRALVHDGLDFVVLSRFAFDNAIHYGLEIDEVLGLGTGSYVGQHIILLRDESRDRIEDGMRVGIDAASIDQVLLAKNACHDRKVEFVQIGYMNLMQAMQKGKIDATVWNEDDFYASGYPFKAVPLGAAGQAVQTQENTEAVVAVRSGNRLLVQTLRSIIDKDVVCSIQQQVMRNELVPTY